VSWLAAMTTHLPSLDLNRFDGATPLRPVPEGSLTLPVRSYSGTALSSMEKQPSINEISIICPRPPPSASRQYNAARIPCVVNIAASESPSEMPLRGGACPGKPLM
jgi:hypothetical protein